MGRRKTGLTAATVLFTGVLISCGGTEPESVPASPTVAAAAESPAATAQAPTATAEAAAPTVPPAESTTVGARIEGFSHSDLTIPVGTMVTWTNHDPTTHTTTSGTPDNVTELWNSGRLGGGRIFLVHLRPAGDLHLYLHHTPLHAGDDHRYRRRAIRSGANRDAGTDRTHLNAHTHTHPDPVAISDSYLRASHSHACAANCHRNSSAAYGHPSVPHRHAGAVIGHRNSSATYGHSSASHSHAGAANGHRNSSTAYGHTHATTAHIHSGAGGAGVALPIQNFSHRDQTVEVGTLITWTNRDPVSHTTTAESGRWDSGTLNNGGSFSFTFAEPGTFAYIGSIHPVLMQATITVTAD